MSEDVPVPVYSSDEEMFNVGKRVALKRPASSAIAITGTESPSSLVAVVSESPSSLVAVVLPPSRQEKKPKIDPKEIKKQLRAEKQLSDSNELRDTCALDELFWASGYLQCWKVFYPCRLLKSGVRHALNENTKEMLRAEGLYNTDVVCYFDKGKVNFNRAIKGDGTMTLADLLPFVPGDQTYIRMCNQVAKGKNNAALLKRLPAVVKDFDELYAQAKARAVIAEAELDKGRAIIEQFAVEARRNKARVEELRAAQPAAAVIEQEVIESELPVLFELRVGDTLLFNGCDDHARIAVVTPGGSFPLELDSIVNFTSYVQGKKLAQRLVPRDLARKVLKAKFREGVEYITLRREVEQYVLLEEVLENSEPVISHTTAAQAMMTQIKKELRKELKGFESLVQK